MDQDEIFQTRPTSKKLQEKELSQQNKRQKRQKRRRAEVESLAQDKQSRNDKATEGKKFRMANSSSSSFVSLQQQRRREVDESSKQSEHRDSDISDKGLPKEQKLSDLRGSQLLVSDPGQANIAGPTIPKLHMEVTKLSDGDVQEQNYNENVEAKRRKEKHARKRKPLRPSREALENDFSDQEDEQALGEELLGKERVQYFRKFCKKTVKFINCRSSKCPKFCRRKKKSQRKKSNDDLSDDENPKVILSPEEQENSLDREVNKAGREDATKLDPSKKDIAAAGTKMHKKNKRRRKREEDMKIQAGEQEDDDQNMICKLCMREQPLYFYQQEDIIKRLPERALTKLLTQMKQDLQMKLAYLKYLKVSAKFCQPCDCPRKKVHTYCQTAHIIRNQRIYCDKCGGQYNLFIKEERVCSSKFISLLIKYFLLTLLLITFTSGFLILDGYLKMRHAQDNPEEAELAEDALLQQQKYNWLSFGFKPDFITNSFDPFTTVSWTHLTHFAIIEIILIGKCVYSQLARAIQTRKKIIHIEVRRFSDKILRETSKRNLNTVIETFQKKKNFALFDKFWYLKRGERFVEDDYHGYVVSQTGDVLHNQHEDNSIWKRSMQKPRALSAIADHSTKSAQPVPPQIKDSNLSLSDDKNQLKDIEAYRSPPKESQTPFSGQLIEMQLLSKPDAEEQPLMSPTLGTYSKMYQRTSPIQPSMKASGELAFLNGQIDLLPSQKTSSQISAVFAETQKPKPEGADFQKNNSNAQSSVNSMQKLPRNPLLNRVLGMHTDYSQRRRISSVVEGSRGGDLQKIHETLYGLNSRFLRRDPYLSEGLKSSNNQQNDEQSPQTIPATASKISQNFSHAFSKYDESHP